MPMKFQAWNPVTNPAVAHFGGWLAGLYPAIYGSNLAYHVAGWILVVVNGGALVWRWWRK